MPYKPKIFKADKLIEVPVEFKALPDQDGKRRVEGYASIFGNVDSYGDVVVKGAFKKTIKDRVGRGLVPFVADHSRKAVDLLGTIVKASEDDTGLGFEAEISRAPSADDAYIKMTEGHLKQTSFAFRTIAEKFPKEGGETVDGKVVYRYLTEMMLLDISPVVLAANDQASITSVKAYEEFMELIEQVELTPEEWKQAATKLLEMCKKFESDPEESAEPVIPLTAQKMLEIESQIIAMDSVLFEKQLRG